MRGIIWGDPHTRYNGFIQDVLLEGGKAKPHPLSKATAGVICSATTCSSEVECLVQIPLCYRNWLPSSTVEPLIKATPDARPPLYKGHLVGSQMC
jgi:hypothetical protein